jgi:cobyrinic acid a,c-diamide synthase
MMQLPRLMVSAAHKSSGKTTFSVGLAAALSAQGRTVQCFKKGPDYIDPLWLARASGRPCFNLDPYLSTEDEMLACLQRQAHGAELALVEGNKGLHDGLALDGRNANAALAKALGLPVLLVLDTRGMTRGIAPLLLGFQAFDRDVRIAGVVLNHVGGPRHESKLRAAIEHYTDIPVLGALARDDGLALPERHLGLMPDAEFDAPSAAVQRLAQAVAAGVDLRRVLALAQAAPPAPAARFAAAVAASPVGQGLRIGIARGAGFCFYYPDDLAALREQGAELVPIDLLHDRQLPAIDGLFIGGGFPEAVMDELQANQALRSELRQAIQAGLPVQAECGGLMLLARRIRWGARSAEMVGVIPADAVMHERPVGRGYVHLAVSEHCPWGREAGAALRGHEFHHSSLEGLPEGLRYAYGVQRGHGVDGRHDGLVLHNVLASYAHLRDAAGGPWVKPFLQFVQTQRRARAEVPQRPGHVSLVGAGPGDPELLTLRAARLLREADVVVYDQLVAPELLDLARPQAQRLFAGKRSSNHSMPQPDINALLVQLARQGLHVVRLKGGDPFVFGRGGEEAQALVAAGLAFEVVPGVTAACGVGAYAGIPLTHRDHAQACVFVTGHLKDGSVDTLDWPALARPRQTLVIYMGLAGLVDICAQLMAHGRGADTPAAVVQEGTTAQQRVVVGTLANLAARVAEAGLSTPCLTVVGEVVALREQLLPGLVAPVQADEPAARPAGSAVRTAAPASAATAAAAASAVLHREDRGLHA